jgi:tripartite-type tricarboxylate transporter receptor subunit TctC
MPPTWWSATCSPVEVDYTVNFGKLWMKIPGGRDALEDGSAARRFARPLKPRFSPAGYTLKRSLTIAGNSLLRTGFRSIAAALLLGCAAASAQTFPAAASTQAFPSKPVRLIAPFAAGGALDLIARAVGQKLAEALGKPVIVDNRAGASGAIGSELVARSAPDGYTLLLGATTTHGINPALNPKLQYDPVRDFTPISLVATIPHVLVVNPAVPAKTLPEFVRLAKAKPGMTFGSAGHGSPHHLAIEMLKNMAAIDLVHVPYKGSGPAMIDLMSGQIQLMSVELTAASQYIKEGRMRPLAIATAKRVAGVDLPTVAELGYPGFEVTAWYAVFGPPGMPRAVVSRLQSDIAKGLQAADLRERFAGLGATPVGTTPEELGTHVRAELARWTKVIKAGNITVE